MKRFWKWLEVRRDLTAVMSQWQSAAGDFYPAVTSMFKVSRHIATAFPNPSGMPMKIVHHADKTIVAVDCEDVGNKILLTSDDIVLHRLDLGLLRKTICDALNDVNIAKTSLDLKSRCYHVGYWEPKKAAKFPVYLLLCPTSKTLYQQILKYQYSCNRGGAILLTPTWDKWNEDIEQLAKSQKMMLMPLSEILTCRDGSFVVTENWTEYIEAFCQLVETTLPQNYRTPKPRPKRAELMAKVERIKKELVDYIRSARDGVVANMDAGRGMRRVKKLTKTELANLAGMKPYDVTRCFQADPQLERLFEIANNAEDLLRYGK